MAGQEVDACCGVDRNLLHALLSPSNVSGCRTCACLVVCHELECYADDHYNFTCRPVTALGSAPPGA